MLWARGARAGCWSLLLGALTACGSAEHPPHADADADAADKTPRLSDGGIVIDPPDPGAKPAACGGQTIRALVDTPKLYFVLDRSGSMRAPLDESGVTRYQAAYRAVGALLRAIGHRVEYGAAVYPGRDGEDSCDGGRQVFRTTPGDSLEDGGPEHNGPKLKDLLVRLSTLDPGGGTPTAAALAGLRPTLEALGGRTYVVLATDGAPNCNQELQCGSSSCIPDIEGVGFESRRCGDGFSCCNEAEVGVGAGANCIDGQATLEEVRALRALGIGTFIIGMPGSEAYTSLLDRLAVEGGTARAGTSAHYVTTDSADLERALFEIGTGVAIDCAVRLESMPADPELVNVYFDGRVVPRGQARGWAWSAPDSLEILGEACEELASGAVLELRVVYGCQTVVR